VRAALDRFCGRVLEECAAVLRNAKTTNHERYLRLYRLIRERDDDIDSAFNDIRRSTAILQLAEIVRLGVVTGQELARFSPETRKLVALATSFGN